MNSQKKTPPLDLPRLVMRRAILVGLLAVGLALLVGLQRTQEAIDEEVEAAMTLAAVMARLGTLASVDDRSALESLRAMQAERLLRHLDLNIRTADGRLLLAPPPPQASGLMDRLVRLHRDHLSEPETRSVSWPVTRPTGAPWTVTLHASSEGERHEAITDLAGIVVALVGCIAGLLLVMRWNMQRAFAPLADLLDAISGIERQAPHGFQRLPTMPIRELESIAVALRHLAGGLEQAEGERRLLSQKVLTLQEDERTRLARELHDEFGQRLTALRFDAAWLLRQVADRPELRSVVQGMSDRCGEVQRDIRQLLVQLRPFGPAGEGVDPGTLPLERLVSMLDALVRSWQETRTGTHCALTLALPPLPETTLPRDLALTVYRISQEALTNAARHAQAQRVELCVRLLLSAGGPGRGWLHWSVRDDGIGLGQPAAALQRGNGLGGMQERVWAHAGQWRILPGTAAWPGLALQAWLPLNPPHDAPCPS